MILQLNHVAIYVKDVEASSRFYKDIIGLKPIDRPAFDFPGAWFEIAGEQQLHIVGQREGEMGDFHDRNLSKPRGNHFAMRVSSCKEVDELLKSKGVDYFPPKKRPDGAIQIFIKDPDGYFVEFTEIDCKILGLKD